MTLSVEIVADAESLRALERELRVDPDLRGTRLTRVDAAPRSGEMGIGAEALQWVADNNQLIGAFVAAIAGWFCRQRAKTRIWVRSGDREIELLSGEIKDPEETARKLRRAIEEEATEEEAIEDSGPNEDGDATEDGEAPGQ